MIYEWFLIVFVDVLLLGVFEGLLCCGYVVVIFLFGGCYECFEVVL